MCALGQHHHSASADLSNWPPAGKSLDPTYLVPRVHVRSSPPEVLPSSSPLSSCVCWSSPFDPITRFCLSPLLPANSKILETQLVKHLGDEVIVLKIRWSGFFFFFFSHFGENSQHCWSQHYVRTTQASTTIKKLNNRGKPACLHHVLCPLCCLFLAMCMINCDCTLYIACQWPFSLFF